ncbi:sodium/glutamate symporter [Oscillatoria sp. CS-180]|uniref:sodium/glutamate symporter n=1 Tax=Oscillatoria sp. CS-180 TaxID=3021720 RepID=UPI00232E647F|nr:sodium/glutamate symporter [Oscillatoria sp. CS-180]MDB9527267.1 sodium/glutamate symporter [Oscillatoria sp. CS-180]
MALFLVAGPSAFAAIAQGGDGSPGYTFVDVFFAFITLSFLVLVGRWIRQHVGVLQALFLPSSIVAGVVALLLGPGVLGGIVSAIAGEGSLLANGLFPQPILAVWSAIPGVFINIVFATIFLGEFIPPPSEIWRRASPQVAFGQSIAWGQYVVGLLLAMLVLGPVFGLPPVSGALIEIGFEGGHGTAAGMAEVFEEVGFEAGPDLAVGMATVGIVTGIIAGVALSNWGRHRGHTVASRQAIDDIPADAQERLPVEEEDPETTEKRRRHLSSLLVDPLSLQFGFVGVAIAIGWVILELLVLIESLTWNRGGTGFEVLGGIPLFPMALVGGIIVQLLLKRLNKQYLISRQLMVRIGGVALDATIVAALASISLAIIARNFGAFAVLAIAGITWNVLFFIYFAPRMIPRAWFERGIGDMGQSMGVTATGILLMRMVDPDDRTGAFESFGYKQLFFEPIVGGGLFTGAAPVLINRFGPLAILLLTGGLLAFWIIFGLWNYKKISQATAIESQRETVRVRQ